MKREGVIELAEKHGATSYRNRSDTQNPAYGFTPEQLHELVLDIEQATLERAAAICDDCAISQDKYSGNMQSAFGADLCASLIRQVKNSND